MFFTSCDDNHKTIKAEEADSIKTDSSKNPSATLEKGNERHFI